MVLTQKLEKSVPHRYKKISFEEGCDDMAESEVRWSLCERHQRLFPDEYAKMNEVTRTKITEKYNGVVMKDSLSEFELYSWGCVC